jgi:hypothetical protein
MIRKLRHQHLGASGVGRAERQFQRRQINGGASLGAIQSPRKRFATTVPVRAADPSKEWRARRELIGTRSTRSFCNLFRSLPAQHVRRKQNLSIERYHPIGR